MISPKISLQAWLSLRKEAKGADESVDVQATSRQNRGKAAWGADQGIDITTWYKTASQADPDKRALFPLSSRRAVIPWYRLFLLLVCLLPSHCVSRG